MPALVVVSVGSGWLFARAEPSFNGARVYTGHVAENELHLRLALVTVSGNREQPLSGCVELLGLPGSEPLSACAGATGVLALNRHFDARLAADTAFCVHLKAAPSGECLAAGTVADLQPTRSETNTAARRGGWVEGHAKGELKLEVGVVQGVLAVPFPTRLRIEGSVDGSPVGFALTASLSGADHEQLSARTEVGGTTELVFTPSDYAVELTLSATALDAEGTKREPETVGTWFGVLPVVPGAAWASRDAGDIVVRSPIARPEIYLDLFDQHDLLQTAVVPLRSVGAESVGHVALSALPPATLFGVTSSEFDMGSMGLVGWPLSGTGEVQATLDARSALVVDGVAQRRAMGANRNRGVLRFTVSSVALGALVEAILFVALVRRTRRGHTAGPWSESVAVWGVALSVLLALLALGFLAH